jgi:ABC-2 type transport system permease protein
VTTAPASAPAPEAEPPEPAASEPGPRLGAGRAIATIARNGIRRTLRDRIALLFIVGLPVVIILIIGSAFGSMESVTVGVVDLDRTDASRDLLAQLDGGEGIDLERFDSADDMRREVRTDAIGAGIVIPAGYGDDLDHGGGDGGGGASGGGGGGATVELVADPTSATAAAVQAAVRAAVGDAGVRIAAARTAADASGADEATATELADEVARDLPQAGVRTESVDEGGDASIGSFDYTAPANLVLFTFVNTMVAGSMLAVERTHGITRRMLATPHGTGTILAGIGASVLAFSLIQSALILAVGALVFGVAWGDPVGVLLVTVLFAVVAASVGLLLGATVSHPDQAQAAGVPIAIALGMLGGCMWPLEIVPPVMRTVGHLTPHAWAMDAWIALVFDRSGVAGIAVELAVLAAFAAVLGLAARRRLRRALTT